MDTKSESLKTNEQIIEELTKDLESSCIKVDENSASKDCNAESTVNSSNLADDPCKLVTDDSDDDAKHKTTDKHDVPNDFVDEELLKDREVGLSESEKEVCILVTHICVYLPACTPNLNFVCPCSFSKRKLRN